MHYAQKNTILFFVNRCKDSPPKNWYLNCYRDECLNTDFRMEVLGDVYGSYILPTLNWKNSINKFPYFKNVPWGDCSKITYETNWILIFSSWPPPVSAKPKYLKLFCYCFKFSIGYLLLIMAYILFWRPDKRAILYLYILCIVFFLFTHTYYFIYAGCATYLFIYYLHFARKALWYIFFYANMFLFLKLCM